MFQQLTIGAEFISRQISALSEPARLVLLGLLFVVVSFFVRKPVAGGREK